MLTTLLTLILEVRDDGKPRMTKLAIVMPNEESEELVSIWAGAGAGAEPTKRISELLSENTALKMELAQRGAKNTNP